MRGPRVAAEAVGTFMLVFIGCGAATVENWSHGSVTSVGISLAFGFVIVAGAYGLGHISGAHFNPAVTAGFWLSGKFPRAEVLPYVVAQIVGSLSASLVLRALLGASAQAAVTIPAIGVGRGLVVEVILSFFLMLVIMAVATDARVAGTVAGLAVGLTVAFEALMGGPLSGASMNPARSFGPALANGMWTAQWIYWIGPLLGATLAVGAYSYLRKGTSHDYRAGS
jgi:MIP family channel proteins